MGRFTLRLPETLHTELDGLAKSEGVSLNQYIVYALTQKATAERLVWAEDQRIPKQLNLPKDLKIVSSERVTKQYQDYELLLSSLGAEATDDEVEQYLSERMSVELEPELEQEAMMRLKKMIQAKQIALQ